MPASCTGTATNPVLTCDLDAATDNNAACPPGCNNQPASTPTCDLDAATDGTADCPAGCDYSSGSEMDLWWSDDSDLVVTGWFGNDTYYWDGLEGPGQMEREKCKFWDEQNLVWNEEGCITVENTSTYSSATATT
jgi:hypothetical protein